MRFSTMRGYLLAALMCGIASPAMLAQRSDEQMIRAARARSNAAIAAHDLDGISREWLIQAELFVPVRCTGGDRYCRERPR
jgi:hypothetical protein